MRIAILNHRAGFSAYIAEMLKTWGLPLFDFVEGADIGSLTPDQTQVLICPASSATGAAGDAAAAFARRGGVVVCHLGYPIRHARIARYQPQEKKASLPRSDLCRRRMHDERYRVVGDGRRSGLFRHANIVF